MIRRLIKPSKNSSFFLFGARGVGKSTYLRDQFLVDQKIGATQIHVIDLLEDEWERRYRLKPDQLLIDAENWSPKDWIVIDEVQKLPGILNRVHKLIAEKKLRFALTGSSARKLKRSSANLLAGRAFIERLFPFSFLELAKSFSLQSALDWGTLPGIFQFQEDEERRKFLEAYSINYVSEEVQMEQLIRKLGPFKTFLEIAAQMSGKQINYHRIAKEAGVDEKTVISYYDILEETYVGQRVPAYHASVRKTQRVAPKFYFFDTGLKRALERSLHSKISERTSAYGEAFEHWVIAETIRLDAYTHSNYKISYFGTRMGGEVDLILSRPGSQTLLLEIKSTDQIDETEVRKLASNSELFPKCFAYYLSRDPAIEKIDKVHCLPWDLGLQEIFQIAPEIKV